MSETGLAALACIALLSGVVWLLSGRAASECDECEQGWRDERDPRD